MLLFNFIWLKYNQFCSLLYLFFEYLVYIIAIKHLFPFTVCIYCIQMFIFYDIFFLFLICTESIFYGFSITVKFSFFIISHFDLILCNTCKL